MITGGGVFLPDLKYMCIRRELRDIKTAVCWLCPNLAEICCWHQCRCNHIKINTEIPSDVRADAVDG